MPKLNRTPESTQPIIVDVSVEEYQADLAKGLQADETMQPGRHVFRRGGFLARHRREESAQPTTAKVRISINIDSDVLDYFRARAAQPNAAPYQTQINQALRSIIEQEQQSSNLLSSNLLISSLTNELLGDSRFIDAIAQRVKERVSSSLT